MSNLRTIYSFFETRNHTGNVSISSYALPFCYFTFIPKLDNSSQIGVSATEDTPAEIFLSRKKIVWDFGDGTISEAVSAQHTYRDPGRYRVKCYLYDKDGNSYYNTFYQDVNVHNYVTDSISLSSTTTSIPLVSSGKIAYPVKLTRTNSWQYYDEVESLAEESNAPIYIKPSIEFRPPSKPTEPPPVQRKFYDYNKPVPIVCYLSAASTDYFRSGLVNQPYGHLLPYSSLYVYKPGFNNTTEYIEVDRITTNSLPVFVKLQDSEVVETTENDPYAVFAGTRGEEILYVKDDLPSGKVDAVISFDTDTPIKSVNSSIVGFSISSVNNTDYSRLLITSNGLDGEGRTSDLFPISKNKFFDTKINFVIKVKDLQDFTIKNLPLLTPNLSLIVDGVSSSQATFYSNFGSLSTLSKGGFYKGYLTCTGASPILNAYISAYTTVGTRTLTGTSNLFDIYPKDYLSVAKIGEDIDFTQTFNDIAFQPTVRDSKILLNDFIGTIFGNISSEPTSPGKLTYEKIKNFVDNNSVIDYANVEQLLSLLKMLNQEGVKFDSNDFTTPQSLGRLISLLSINYTRLLGNNDAAEYDFKKYGYNSSDFYGLNLGDEVTISHTVIPGEDLVAFEKVSGKYSLLNTYLPLCAGSITVTSNTYTLSNYNNTWGWNLVLPSDGYGANLSNYYLFYQYKRTFNEELLNNKINKIDSMSTIFESEVDGRYQAVVASGGYIFVSRDYGDTLTVEENIRRWMGISINSDGRYQTAVALNDYIYTSNDYGNTWNSRDTIKDWNDIAINDNGKYQTAVVKNGYIYTSGDYGNSWVERGASRDWRSVFVSGDGRYQTAVAFSDYIYISNDYGVTWNQKEMQRAWRDVSMSHGGRYQSAIAVGDRIYTSTDYGNNWIPREDARQWRGISVSGDGKYQTAVCDNDFIYVSSDYGNTWTAKASIELWEDVAISYSGKYQTACTDVLFNLGDIYISSDYGNTWTAKSGPFRRYFGVAINRHKPPGLSFSTWSEKDGVVSNMIANDLYKGTNLFE